MPVDWMQRADKWMSKLYIWAHNLFFYLNTDNFDKCDSALYQAPFRMTVSQRRGKRYIFYPGASYFLVLYLCLWEEEAAVLCDASLLPVLASAAPVSAPFLAVLAAVLWLEVPVATCEKRKTWECAISLGFIVINDQNRNVMSFWNLVLLTLHFNLPFFLYYWNLKTSN